MIYDEYIYIYISLHLVIDAIFFFLIVDEC